MWNRIASIKQFALVEKGVLIQDSMHFIVGESLEYLASILNSNLIQWYLFIYIGEAAGGNAGNSDNIRILSIPHTDNNIRLSNEDVYELYKLTDEEKLYIEEKSTICFL